MICFCNYFINLFYKYCFGYKFNCDVCSTRFRYKQNYIHHIKEEHSFIFNYDDVIINYI